MNVMAAKNDAAPTMNTVTGLLAIAPETVTNVEVGW